MERFTGIIGILLILGIAYLLSNNKKNIDIRLIVWGLGLQIFFGINSCMYLSIVPTNTLLNYYLNLFLCL